MKNYLNTALSLFPDGTPSEIRFRVLSLFCGGQSSGRIPRRFGLENKTKLKIGRFVAEMRANDAAGFGAFREDVAKQSAFFDKAKLDQAFGDEPESPESFELRPENSPKEIHIRQLGYYGRRRNEKSKKTGGDND